MSGVLVLLCSLCARLGGAVGWRAQVARPLAPERQVRPKRGQQQQAEQGKEGTDARVLSSSACPTAPLAPLRTGNQASFVLFFRRLLVAVHRCSAQSSTLSLQIDEVGIDCPGPSSDAVAFDRCRLTGFASHRWPLRRVRQCTCHILPLPHVYSVLAPKAIRNHNKHADPSLRHGVARSFFLTPPDWG